MYRIGSRRKIVILTILILFNTIFTSTEMRAEQDSMDETEEKLMDISEKEREILDSLFTQAQEIEVIEREKERITLDIKNMKTEIDDLDKKIQKESQNYHNELDLLKQVLRSYQRMGPSSYIEIILDSDNITNLLRRINTLRDLAKNTGELLDSIYGRQDKLVKEKIKIDKKLSLLEETENKLVRTIEEGQQKVKQLERLLSSLEGDREYYQERLNNIMTAIDEVTLLIRHSTKEFTHIIKKGDLPKDQLELKLVDKGIRGIINEDVFNEIIGANTNLPKILLHFHPNIVEMEFPQKNLLLRGSFIILDGQTLKLRVEEGSFYDFILKKETIDKFFEEGYFVLDIEPLIGTNVVKSIEVKDGYLELTVQTKLF